MQRRSLSPLAPASPLVRTRSRPAWPQAARLPAASSPRRATRAPGLLVLALTGAVAFVGVRGGGGSGRADEGGAAPATGVLVPQAASAGNQTASAGNQAASAGNQAASAGNQAASAGNQAASAGNQAPSAGTDGHGRRSGSVSRLSVAGLKAEAFTTASGQRGWRVRLPGGRPLATPAVVGDTVFVGGGFGSHEFYAFDAASGAARWGIRVSDDGPTAAVVADGHVVFNTESCTLFVVDARTGKHEWSRWLGDPLMSQPAVADGVIYMAYPGRGGHRLIALGLADGRTRFDAAIAGDIISAPVVDGDSVYLTTFDGTVYRYRRGDGRLVWRNQMNATSAPWIVDGQIHVAQRTAAAGSGRGNDEGFRRLALSGTVDGAIQGRHRARYLDRDVQARSDYARAQAADDASVGFGGGAPTVAKVSQAAANVGQATVRGLWEYQGSRPMVIGANNYTTQGDTVRALDVASGGERWSRRLAGDMARSGGHLASPPAWAAGKLVVGTVGGELVTFDAASGRELGRIAVRDEIRFQPALAHGRIVVGTARGTLVSIDTGDASLDGWTMWGGGPRHNGPEAAAQHAAR